MKIYFLSALPCALTVGGAYFGRTDSFGRCAELDARDELFVEFHPENALPIGFFITENLRFSPPERCEVYLLPDGIAVYAKHFLPADFSLNVAAQKRIDGSLVTLFRQGDWQICIENEKGMFVKPLPPAFYPTEIDGCQHTLLLTAPDAFSLLDETGHFLLHERHESVRLDGDELHAVLPLCDSKNRRARCVWKITDGECFQTEFTITEQGQGNAATDGLIAYAFFESVLIGADYTPFLSESLRKDAEKIPAFLGNFLSVLPRDDENSCGLVYRKAERLFEMKIFRVSVSDGKITDIQG